MASPTDWKPMRCPYCSTELTSAGPLPLMVGMLIVCSGCAGPVRLHEKGDYLVPLGPGELTSEVAVDVEKLQALVKAAWVRGRPPGKVWRTVQLCRPCYVSFAVDRAASVLTESRDSPCGLCRQPTDSGIFRRLLVDAEA